MQQQKIETFFQQVSLNEDETLFRLWTHNAHGRYFVSNQGRVFSICMSDWHELKKQVNNRGYEYVSLWYHGDKENVCIHKIVAECFIPNPYEGKKGIQIHHKDFQKQNNCYLNLQYLTDREHRRIHEEHRKQLKEQSKDNGEL